MFFRKFLDEMYVREYNREYFVLPVNINKKSMLEDPELSMFVRNNYAKEVVDCLLEFLHQHYKDGRSNFIIQLNRGVNAETFKKLGYKDDVSNRIQLFAYKLLKNLKPEHFCEDRCKDETDAFVFKIPARSLLLEPNPNIKASTYAYLKFSFIYDVDIFDKNRKYISVGKNNYGDLVIVPSKLKLNQISMHTSRKGNTKFDRYIEQLSRH